MQENSIKLTFDESTKKDILSYINKEVNHEGLIVEKENPSQKVLSMEGDEVSINDTF